jgi:hypothetical protein
MRIKISTTLQWPLERQLSSEIHARIDQVAINKEIDECDAWIVYQGLHRTETTNVPSNRIFFFTYEPPGLHHYQNDFLAQFSAVTSCQNLQHPRLCKRHQAQPWLAGIARETGQNIHKSHNYRFNCDDFMAMGPAPKNRPLSAICSNKSLVPGHQERLKFVALLQEELKDRFELFGYGFRPLEDKWDALAPYTYHLVLENCCVPHYWSEKLADAYLASCFPIVWGCPNLAEYFPEDSFLLLDPQDPKLAAEKICEAIASPLSEKQRLAVAEARQRILTEYNLFSEIIRLCDATPPAPRSKTRLRDERLYLPGGWLRPTIRLFTDAWRKQ